MTEIEAVVSRSQRPRVSRDDRAMVVIGACTIRDQVVKRNASDQIVSGGVSQTLGARRALNVSTLVSWLVSASTAELILYCVTD